MIGIGNTLLGRGRSQKTLAPEPSPADRPAQVPHFASSAALPTHDQIAQRAFEIYAANGYAPDRSEQNWLQAERELLEETLDAEV